MGKKLGIAHDRTIIVAAISAQVFWPTSIQPHKNLRFLLTIFSNFHKNF